MSRIPALSREEMDVEQQKVYDATLATTGGSAGDHRSAMRIRRASGGFTTHRVRICLIVR
jgi:hypothetical protein